MHYVVKININGTFTITQRPGRPATKVIHFEHINSVVIVLLSRLDSSTMDVLAVLDNWCVFLKTYQGL